MSHLVIRVYRSTSGDHFQWLGALFVSKCTSRLADKKWLKRIGTYDSLVQRLLGPNLMNRFVDLAWILVICGVALLSAEPSIFEAGLQAPTRLFSAHVDPLQTCFSG